MSQWMFPSEVRSRLRILSVGAVALALASWLPHHDAGVVGLLTTLGIYELGAIGLALLPWTSAETEIFAEVLQAARNAARSAAARLWSQS